MNKKGCLFAGLYVLGLFVAEGTLGQFIETHRNHITGRAAINSVFMWLSLITFLCLLPFMRHCRLFA